MIAEDSEPSLLLAEDWAADAVAETTNGYPAMSGVLMWSSEGDQADDYEDLATLEAPSAWRPEAVADTAVRTIIYTAGPTGRPRVSRPLTAPSSSACSASSSLMASALTGRCLNGAAHLPRGRPNLFANPVLYAGGAVLVARTFDLSQALRPSSATLRSS